MSRWRVLCKSKMRPTGMAIRSDINMILAAMPCQWPCRRRPFLVSLFFLLLIVEYTTYVHAFAHSPWQRPKQPMLSTHRAMSRIVRHSYNEDYYRHSLKKLLFLCHNKGNAESLLQHVHDKERNNGVDAFNRKWRGALFVLFAERITSITTSIEAAIQLNTTFTESNKRQKHLKTMDTKLHMFSRRRRAKTTAAILRRTLVVLLGVITSNLTARVHPALAASMQTTSTRQLGLFPLAVAAASALIMGGLAMTFVGLPGIAKQVTIACARCTLQLFLVGALILQRLFGTTSPNIVLAWIVGVGCIASQEAYSRVQYRYPKLQRHLLLSVLMGGLSVVAIAMYILQCQLASPQTIIPVSGMIFGNTLTAAGLAANSLTNQFVSQKSQTELLLARGATTHEASLPHVRSALSAALTPTINALSVTGIVHMPGLMTGQILAGTSPRQASAYQVMIWFLITTSASGMVLALQQLIKSAVFDYDMSRFKNIDLNDNGKKDNDEKQIQESEEESETKSFVSRLSEAGRLAASFFGIRLSNAKNRVMNQEQAHNETAFVTEQPPIVVGSAPPRVVTKVANSTAQHPTNSEKQEPVLVVNKLLVERPNLLFSFNLYKGDRIGIVGPSGVGKTQLLRTLVGLEQGDVREAVLLGGFRCLQFSMPDWRCKVSWLPQDRPTLDGTPQQFYNDILGFKSQRHRDSQLKNKSPEYYCQQWNLDDTAFQSTPWSALSGGEAQRAALAISLALRPEVLLLDESMGALDTQTAQLVEETLIQSGIPIVLVTHSNRQLERFCTHQIDLGVQ